MIESIPQSSQSDPSKLSIQKISTMDAEFEVPGDKSISHRVAMVAGLAQGTSRITGFLPSADSVNTLNIMQSCGVSYEVHEEFPGKGPTALAITGHGMQLSSPSTALDCGNSGTGMRLLGGLLAGQQFSSEIIGDESLSGRPMGRIITPLRQMGAKISAQGEKEGCAPLHVAPSKLHAIHYTLPMASAQVKSAILFAGLYAEGLTEVTQPAMTRDHTERIFSDFGVTVGVSGLHVSLQGGQSFTARDYHVPGDISSAAFWLVAAAALPGAKLRLRNVGLNPTRSAVINALKRMGATIICHPSTNHDSQGEPVGDIEIYGKQLNAIELEKEEIPNLIDEIPVLAVAATQAKGTSRVRNASELRIKETDRIHAVVTNLRLMGAQIEEFGDGFEVTGGAPLQAAEVDSFDDHRIAMAFAVAGLFAENGKTVVTNADCIDISYPGFAKQLTAICRESTNPADFQLPSRNVSP